MGGPAKTAKELGTFRTHCIHWFVFCMDMKLEGDMALEHLAIQRCNFQLALYTVHLATGNSVSCRSIKAATIEKYIRSVAKFCARSNPRDPRKLEQTHKTLAPVIQGVINEVQRWENIPDRREPFTIEMLRYLQELYTSQPHIYDSDSSLAAMIDWSSTGLYDGFRLSEWAQPNGHSAINNPHLNKRGEACAFCVDDFRFLSDDKIRIPVDQVFTLDPASPSVGRTFVKYRTQKNGKNGEERQHTRNISLTAPCHVASCVRIVQRFFRLLGFQHFVPLCVYRHDDGTIRYITASIIESTFRMAAAHVYKLDPVKDSAHLSRWSAHSLRVGACVILHGMGFTDTQIQFLLRWQSNAFFVYLRNIAGLAHKQNRALDDLSTMPNFI
jgi:hypothetical protein